MSKQQCPSCKGKNTRDFLDKIFCDDCNKFFAKKKEKTEPKSVVTCPYCGNHAVLIDSKEIYGRSYGMAYICKPCDAYVGVHANSNKPLGTLANRELREWRNKAHKAFDPLWKSGRMSRNQAYSWLKATMNVSSSKAHIAMFDVEQCQALIKAVGEMTP